VSSVVLYLKVVKVNFFAFSRVLVHCNCSFEYCNIIGRYTQQQLTLRNHLVVSLQTRGGHLVEDEGSTGKQTAVSAPSDPTVHMWHTYHPAAAIDLDALLVDQRQSAMQDTSGYPTSVDNPSQDELALPCQARLSLLMQPFICFSACKRPFSPLIVAMICCNHRVCSRPSGPLERTAPLRFLTRLPTMHIM
jgi:hypothetical protein